MTMMRGAANGHDVPEMSPMPRRRCRRTGRRAVSEEMPYGNYSLLWSNLRSIRPSWRRLVSTVFWFRLSQTGCSVCRAILFSQSKGGSQCQDRIHWHWLRIIAAIDFRNSRLDRSFRNRCHHGTAPEHVTRQRHFGPQTMRRSAPPFPHPLVDCIATGRDPSVLEREGLVERIGPKGQPVGRHSLGLVYRAHVGDSLCCHTSEGPSH